MNPFLIILILTGAVILWFLLSFIFYPLGRFIYRIYKEAVDEINREDTAEKQSKN